MPTPKPATKTLSRRDNFSQAVIQILYKRAGGKCCRCFAPTFGPVSNNPTKSVNIGQAAHIAAAAPLGPRYDAKMSAEERTSATNGMWMCSNCHDIIDRDVDEYPTAKLKKMKKEAEKRANSLMGVAPTQPHTDSLSAGVSASTIVEIRKSKAEIMALNGSPIGQAQGEELLAAVSFINPEVDGYLPEVGLELLAYFEQLTAYCGDPLVLLEVVRRLKVLADIFHKEWSERDVEQISSLSNSAIKGASRRSRLYQSATALLKDLSQYEELKRKGLHKIPRGYLSDLRGSDRRGRDLVDGDIAPQPAKRFHGDDASGGPPPLPSETAGGTPPVKGVGGDDRYLELMDKLSASEDPVEIDRIEEELTEMGYEPNII